MPSIGFVNFDRIVADADICEGQPCIKGSRITVSAILTFIAGGMSPAEILGEYPKLSLEDVNQALAFAASRIPAVSHVDQNAAG